MQWDEELNCLVDEMGMPLKRHEVLELRKYIARHLRRSLPDLAHAFNIRLRGVNPKWADNDPMQPEGME